MSVASLAAAASALRRSHRSASLFFLPPRRRVRGFGTRFTSFSVFRDPRWSRPTEWSSRPSGPVVQAPLSQAGLLNNDLDIAGF